MKHKGIIADMHTHSSHSHDSQCKLEDLYRAEKEKGATYFALTNHYDGASSLRFDNATPIREAQQCVRIMNEQNKGECEILSGVELSEIFWFPNLYEVVKSFGDFDVVIGSVHLVRYKDKRQAYSRIDFSDWTDQMIAEYLDAYFDDIFTLLETTDFDILAHLTCPLRYITGKYNIKPDMSPYADKIEKILNQIIEKNIALEVNTSSYDVISDFFPSRDIIEKYYKMGGRLITIASDAHRSEDACKCFDEALAFLKEVGFKHIYYYKNRTPIPIEI